MSWPDAFVIFDKYGLPLILLIGAGLFAWKKGWPLFEKFLLGILAHLDQTRKDGQEAMDKYIESMGKRDAAIQAFAASVSGSLDELKLSIDKLVDVSDEQKELIRSNIKASENLITLVSKRERR